MSHEKKKGGGEGEGGHSVGLWYVSFSDMITLLLSFFVMLTTFSSYDNEARQRFAGACHYVVSNSVFPAKDIPRQSFAQFVNPVVNYTETGSEKPNELSDQNVTNPLRGDVTPDDRAFFQQKVLTLPARSLFGRDGQFSEEGQRLLSCMAQYLRKNPSSVLIACPPNGEAGQAVISPSYRIERAYTVLQHLVTQEKIPASQLAVYQPAAAQSNPHAGQAVIEITLRNGGIFR